MYKIYKVSAGDSLESIAHKFNTTVSNLQDINDKDYIVVDELIIVPNNKKNDYFDTYVIEKGDTLYSISKNNNISLMDLLNLNGLDKENYIYPGQEILVPKKDIKIVVTNKDDSIESTCKRLGLDSSTLLEQNNNILLSPDQVLVYRK